MAEACGQLICYPGSTLSTMISDGQLESAICGIFDPGTARVHLMAIHNAYFDESGKFQKQNVVSFCGLVSLPEDWKKFDVSWKALLRKHGISFLHLSKSGLSIDALREFINCVTEHIELGIAVAVDSTALRSNPRNQILDVKGDPYRFAFMNAIGNALGHVGTTQDQICIMCDEEQEYFIKCFKLLATFKGFDPVLAHQIVGFCSGDDKAYPPLQAADLLSGIVRQEADARFLQAPRSEQSFLFQDFQPNSERRLRFSPQSRFWDAAALEQHINDAIMRQREMMNP